MFASPSSLFMPTRAENTVSSPSPASDMAVCMFTDTPSKLSFNTKLTTPAIASAPYTAEAPPVIVSTRAIAAVGIVFRSTTRDALTGWPRLPSTSTSVRFVPTPRRLPVPMPSDTVGDVWISPTALNWLCAGVNCGIWFRIVSTLIVLDWSSRACRSS